jgi:hypothetical protein
LWWTHQQPTPRFPPPATPMTTLHRCTPPTNHLRRRTAQVPLRRRLKKPLPTSAASLYELPAVVSGKKPVGRLAPKGDKQPAPQEIVARTRRRQRLNVAWYGGRLGGGGAGGRRGRQAGEWAFWLRSQRCGAGWGWNGLLQDPVRRLPLQQCPAGCGICYYVASPQPPERGRKGQPSSRIHRLLIEFPHSTVTLLARLRGLSTSQPRSTAT